MGRAINPISKTNREGTGVAPDVSVPADKALNTAHLMALEKELPGVKEPQLKSAIGQEIEKLNAQLGEGKGTR
jgi:hypothetical protein